MQRPSFLIAIDPGAKGAIASYATSYSPPGEPVWTVEKLRETPQDRFLQLEGMPGALAAWKRPEWPSWKL